MGTGTVSRPTRSSLIAVLMSLFAASPGFAQGVNLDEAWYACKVHADCVLVAGMCGAPEGVNAGHLPAAKAAVAELRRQNAIATTGASRCAKWEGDPFAYAEPHCADVGAKRRCVVKYPPGKKPVFAKP